MRRLELSGSQGTSGLRKPFRPVQRGGGIKCSYFVLNLLTAFVKTSRHLGGCCSASSNGNTTSKNLKRAKEISPSERKHNRSVASLLCLRK